MNACEGMNEELNSLEKNLEKHSGATEKLRTLGNLKGKISTKVSSITKEHKFFTQNTVCPTCNQDIEETFRINRINDAQTKAKELQSGYKELEEAIKKEEERERQFLLLSKEITSLTHGISKKQYSNRWMFNDKSEIWNRKIQRITDNLAKQKY